jgi:hypothetical protein
MEYDLEFDNKEERRVITGPEQTIARALGEINQDQVTRKSHRGYSSRNADGLSPERQSRIAFLYNNPLNKLDDSVFQLTLNLYE